MNASPRSTETRAGAADIAAMLGVGDVDLGVFTEDELALFDAETHLNRYPGDAPVLAAAARSLLARGYAARADDDNLMFGSELSLVLQARSTGRAVLSIVRRAENEAREHSVYELAPEVVLEDLVETPGVHSFHLRKPARALADLARFVRGGATRSVAGETRKIPFNPSDESADPLADLDSDAVAIAFVTSWRRTDPDHLLSVAAALIEDRAGTIWFAQPDRETSVIDAQSMDAAELQGFLTSLFERPNTA